VHVLEPPPWNLRILLVDSGVQRNTKRMVELGETTLTALGNVAASTLLRGIEEIVRLAVVYLEKEENIAYPKLEVIL